MTNGHNFDNIYSAKLTVPYNQNSGQKEVHMGTMYINPKEETAQTFLAREGKFFVETPYWQDKEDGHLFACIAIVKNMEVGVVCRNKQEFEKWTSYNWTDPRYWYLISIEKLSAASNW